MHEHFFIAGELLARDIPLVSLAPRFVGKFQKGADVLAGIRDEDVDVGATPKALVLRRDKVELFRYEPTAKRTVETPVLIVYGLIGRYTMADLQTDRSLVRSLLGKDYARMIDHLETFDFPAALKIFKHYLAAHPELAEEATTWH